MSIPANFLDELIARSDIVDVISDYVHLTKKGSNLFGLCPFHSEKTGSFPFPRISRFTTALAAAKAAA